MKYLFLVLFLVMTISSSGAGRCPVSAKGIASPIPTFPSAVSKEDRWDEAFHHTFEVLCKNLKTPNYFFPGYRTHPSPNYKGAYLWDTAFITQIWMYWDPTIAQEALLWVLRFQTEEGLVPHAIAELLFVPLRINKSQPPLLAWASWRIYEKSKDKDFLRAAYPKLKKYHEWLMRERRHPDGLYFWGDAYESGIDNSPRFSNRDESSVDDTTKLASVDITSYMALSMEALAKMARELNLSADEATFNAQYAHLKQTMNEKLWDQKHSTYYDWDYRKNDFIRIRTISDLTPLVAGIPDEAKAKKLMGDIMNPLRYNTTIPFPTVARDDKVFVKDMWQGPVWINTAYLGILGVDRYGYHQEAVQLAYRLTKGVYETWKNTGEFFEFYDPERYDTKELHRKKGNLWKRITLGNKPVRDLVGWTGLANTLVFEYGHEWKNLPKANTAPLPPTLAGPESEVH